MPPVPFPVPKAHGGDVPGPWAAEHYTSQSWHSARDNPDGGRALRRQQRAAAFQAQQASQWAAAKAVDGAAPKPMGRQVVGAAKGAGGQLLGGPQLANQACRNCEARHFAVRCARRFCRLCCFAHVDGPCEWHRLNAEAMEAVAKAKAPPKGPPPAPGGERA